MVGNYATPIIYSTIEEVYFAPFTQKQKRVTTFAVTLDKKYIHFYSTSQDFNNEKRKMKNENYSYRPF